MSLSMLTCGSEDIQFPSMLVERASRLSSEIDVSDKAARNSLSLSNCSDGVDLCLQFLQVGDEVCMIWPIL